MLNPDQQEAVDTREGAIALIAGPGAGKTKTLVERYDALTGSGVRRSEILCVTFTKEAATEMERRAGKGNFRTFHSYGYSVIAAEKGRPPMEPELRNRLLFKLIRKYGLEYKELTGYISRMRHKNITPEEAMEEDGTFKYGYPRAYADYEAERKAAGWIDFDSMIRDAVNLLEDPAVRARHQWKYVMADECQDTDDLQFRFLQLITEKYGNIMCVGDPGQSIYMFRGAQPENLTDFTRWFPKGRYIYLGKNYRSTHRIVQFVRENYPIESDLRDKLLPHRDEHGTDVEFRMFLNDQAEAEDAVACAARDPLNSAILARTNRMLAPLENFCIENNIKYHLLGKSGFWKQNEIVRTIDKLKPFGTMRPDRALEILMPDIERHYQAEDATPEDNYALENVRTLREIGKKFPDCAAFCAYANRAMHSRKTKKGLTISTVHQAKGTEYKNVFVIGALPGMMPHAKGNYSEEKRIWFVAISRAMDYLRVSFTAMPSPFIRRYITEEVLDQMRKDAGKVEKLEKQGALFNG